MSIIREDIVAIAWKVESSPFQEMLKDIQCMQSSITDIVGDIQKEFAEIGKLTEGLRKGFAALVPDPDIFENNLEKISGMLGGAMKKSFEKGLGKVADKLLPSLRKELVKLTTSMNDLAPVIETVTDELKKMRAIDKTKKTIDILNKGLTFLTTNGEQAGEGIFGLLSSLALLATKAKAAYAATGNLATALVGLFSKAGIVGLGIGLLGTLGYIIYHEVTRPTREAKKAMEEIGSQFSETINIINNGQADLSKYEFAFGAFYEEQNRLSQSTEEVQSNINEILCRYMDERKKMTQKDIQTLREYYDEIEQLHQRELLIKQKEIAAVADISAIRATNIAPDTLEFKTAMAEDIADAKVLADEALQSLNKSTTTQMAALATQWNQVLVDKDTMPIAKFEAELAKYEAAQKSIMEGAEQQRKEIESSFARIPSVYTETYAEYVTQNSELRTKLAELNTKQLEEMKAYEDSKTDIETSSLHNEKERIDLMDRIVSDHAFAMSELAKEFTANLSTEEQQQIANLMAYASETEMYGGKLEASTQGMVDSLLLTWDSLDDGIKSSMRETMQGGLDALAEKEPSLFAKMSAIGTSLISRLKAALGVASPSWKAKEALNDVMLGAQEGVEKGEAGLLSKLGGVASTIMEKFKNFGSKIKEGFTSAFEKVKEFFGGGQGQEEAGEFQLPIVQADKYQQDLQKVQNVTRATRQALYQSFLMMKNDITGFANEVNLKAAQVEARFTAMAASIRETLDALDLQPVGVQIMQGFHEGILSMIPAVMETVRALASDIKTTLKNAMDVNSPSRVTMEIGAAVGEGLVVGMRNTMADVHGQALALAASSLPMPAHTPESAPAVAGAAGSTTNHYTPQFNLTIGSSASGEERDLERKVRGWITDTFNKLLRQGAGGARREI